MPRSRVVSSTVPRSEDSLRAERQVLHGQVGQYVDRIRDDKHDRLFFQAVLFEVRQNIAEQFHIAVDQIEPAFVRLAAQPRRDDDDVRVGRQFGSAPDDPLIGDERAAVHQVERLPVGQIAVDVDQRNLCARSVRPAVQTPRRTPPALRRR